MFGRNNRELDVHIQAANTHPLSKGQLRMARGLLRGSGLTVPSAEGVRFAHAKTALPVSSQVEIVPVESVVEVETKEE